jgi:hypothetical protein
MTLNLTLNTVRNKTNGEKSITIQEAQESPSPSSQRRVGAEGKLASLKCTGQVKIASSFSAFSNPP